MDLPPLSHQALLGCDLCHLVVLFGLNVHKGDMSTNGCCWWYIVLWVVASRRGRAVDWDILKERLVELRPHRAGADPPPHRPHAPPLAGKVQAHTSQRRCDCFGCSLLQHSEN
uniref:ACT domain-containing protein n=1 Tax=Triticum urartu TaxID=4572 RepID=A0A8R7RC52_TRIUA